jgi:hypothetical protein
MLTSYAGHGAHLSTYPWGGILTRRAFSKMVMTETP